MNTPVLRIASLEAQLSDRCLELAESRKRVKELEEAIREHSKHRSPELTSGGDINLWIKLAKEYSNE